VLLLGAIVNAIAASGPRRATWPGFAIFGWSYFLWSFGGLSRAGLEPPPLVTTVVLQALRERIHPELTYIAPPTVSFSPPASSAPTTAFVSRSMIVGTPLWAGDEVNYTRVGESLSTLVFAVVGAVWAQLAYRARDRRAADP
jgi:hypothetical protein